MFSLQGGSPPHIVPSPTNLGLRAFFFLFTHSTLVPSVGDRTKIYDYTIHDVLRVLYAVDSVRVPPCSLNKVRDRTSKICNYQWCSGKNYTVHAVLVLCVLVLLARVPLCT